MAKTRTLQRTPNLGLTLKMAKAAAPAAPAEPCPPAEPACKPAIGPARWWNPETSAYDLETVTITQFVSNGDPPYLMYADGSYAECFALYAACVTGNLCGCGVAWETQWIPTVGPSAVGWLEILTPDRSLAVAPNLQESYRSAESAGGVLEAVATVICGESAQVLAPIYLVIEAAEGWC